jgi:hypothetical protein
VSGGALVEVPSYAARAWKGAELIRADSEAVEVAAGPCVTLPAASGAPERPDYWVIEMGHAKHARLPFPARFHLYHYGGSDYRLVALERPESFAPPG